MPQYMLALYDDPSGWKKLSPEEIQKTVEKYTTWSKRPYVIQGKRLAADLGRVLRSTNGKARATDGPYSETKEVMGGIYLIEAKDYDEAVERTLDHPHLEHGTIELRQLYS
jgi:hypothetical protein